MAVRKQCKSQGCKTCPKCEHPWWLDYQHKGLRHRMPADEFAIPRMAEGHQRPVQTKQEAKDWERLFIREIKAGRDPKLLPGCSVRSTITIVADLLDACERTRRAGGLAERCNNQGAAQDPQSASRTPARLGARAARRHPALPHDVSRHPVSRHTEPGAEHATRSDQLGDVPEAPSAAGESVPQVRRDDSCEDEQKRDSRVAPAEEKA